MISPGRKYSIDDAEENIQKSLALSPYNEVYWEQLGDIKSEKKSIAEALNAYHHLNY